MSDIAATMRSAKDLLRKLSNDHGECRMCKRQSPLHDEDCRLHAVYHDMVSAIDQYEAVLEVMRQALAYESQAFDEDEEIDGGDLVEWFTEWREQAHEVLQA